MHVRKDRNLKKDEKIVKTFGERLAEAFLVENFTEKCLSEKGERLPQ